MRRPAFYLLAGIISFQLVIVAGVIAGCFVTKTERCTDGQAAELMTYIVAQAFALYAAEKQ